MQDNNQTDAPQDNTVSGHVSAPLDPPSGGLTSFTMDPPHHDDPKTPDNAPASSPPTLDKIEEDVAAKTKEKTNPALPPADFVPPSKTSTPPSEDSNLTDIKQKALGQLSPMLGHLDQPPEEKFKTLLMLIQASDDQNLINEAYETAQQITDEKAKAQALLDIVNEINYFTQNKQQS